MFLGKLWTFYLEFCFGNQFITDIPLSVKGKRASSWVWHWVQTLPTCLNVSCLSQSIFRIVPSTIFVLQSPHSPISSQAMTALLWSSTIYRFRVPRKPLWYRQRASESPVKNLKKPMRPWYHLLLLKRDQNLRGLKKYTKLRKDTRRSQAENQNSSLRKDGSRDCWKQTAEGRGEPWRKGRRAKLPKPEWK